MCVYILASVWVFSLLDGFPLSPRRLGCCGTCHPVHHLHDSGHQSMHPATVSLCPSINATKRTSDTCNPAFSTLTNSTSSGRIPTSLRTGGLQVCGLPVLSRHLVSLLLTRYREPSHVVPYPNRGRRANPCMARPATPRLSKARKSPPGTTHRTLRRCHSFGFVPYSQRGPDRKTNCLLYVKRNT